MNISSVLRIALATCALLVGSSSSVQAAIIYAPGDSVSTEGANNNCIPFSCFGPSRYQQVYDAALFGNTAGFIRSLMFRTENGNAGFSDQTLNLTITLANTTATSESLSTNFASNLGNNGIVVMSGTQTFSAQARGTNPSFNFIIDVADTFYYDGVSSLLMDIRLNSGSILTSLDAVYSPTSGIGRMVNSIDSLTGYGDSLGLVTAFDVEGTKVPEPATLALFGIALAGIASTRRKRKPAL